MQQIIMVNDQYKFHRNTFIRGNLTALLCYLFMMSYAVFGSEEYDLWRLHYTLSIVYIMGLIWYYIEAGSSNKWTLGERYKHPLSVVFLMYCEKMQGDGYTAIRQDIIDEFEEMDDEDLSLVTWQLQAYALCAIVIINVVLFVAPMMLSTIV